MYSPSSIIVYRLNLPLLLFSKPILSMTNGPNCRHILQNFHIVLSSKSTTAHLDPRRFFLNVRARNVRLGWGLISRRRIVMVSVAPRLHRSLPLHNNEVSGCLKLVLKIPRPSTRPPRRKYPDVAGSLKRPSVPPFF